MRTILLLTISNIFMTFAWYGHLKYRSEALWKVILASWGIAFFEYCFQVPANRIASANSILRSSKPFRSDYIDGVRGFLRHLSRRKIEVELRGWAYSSFFISDEISRGPSLAPTQSFPVILNNEVPPA